MKYVTKYIPFPNRINEEGTNVMFMINDEWTEPCDFDSYMGPDIQSVAGAVLCLCNDEPSQIELADQTLDEGLEFDRNDFEVKWTNSKGESSFTLSDVNHEDDEKLPVLKAFIKTMEPKRIVISEEAAEKFRTAKEESKERMAAKFPPDEIMKWMKGKTDATNELNGGTLDKSTFMLGMMAMWSYMNKKTKENENQKD